MRSEGYCGCLSVSQCVHDYSRTAGNEGASERYQQLQRNKRSKIKKAILLKRRRSRSRNWHSVVLVVIGVGCWCFLFR